MSFVKDEEGVFMDNHNLFSSRQLKGSCSEDVVAKVILDAVIGSLASHIDVVLV